MNVGGGRTFKRNGRVRSPRYWGCTLEGNAGNLASPELCLCLSMKQAGCFTPALLCDSYAVSPKAESIGPHTGTPETTDPNQSCLLLSQFSSDICYFHGKPVPIFVIINPVLQYMGLRQRRLEI